MSTPSSRPGVAGPPTKHQLALMIWLAVFPTLTVLNLALGDWLRTLTPVLRTFMLATIAVPIVIYTLMPQLHRLRVRLIGAKNMLRDRPGVTEDDVTMRAIVQDSYGPAERWRLAEIAEPEIADSEVLVNVHAAGIDRGTWHAMTGLPYLGRLYFGLRKPKRPVPGLDVAGTVAAIGADVTRFAVGDEVFGISKGSFAEHASAREDKLVPKPVNITFEQAAVVAISGLTALQSLRDAGRVKAGQHVLIIGASGGVGTFAVQIAKTFGAEVTGVCSTTKTELVTSIGADHVIDYTQDDFAHGPQRYNLIIDIGGNSSLTRLRRALTPRGTVVIVGGEDSGRWTGMGRQLRAIALSPFVRQRLTIRIPKETHADIELLAELSEAGQLTPVIDRTYPLADAADAMRYLEAGQARGKIAIAV